MAVRCKRQRLLLDTVQCVVPSSSSAQSLKNVANVSQNNTRPLGFIDTKAGQSRCLELHAPD